jgi:hypothetical protein
VLVASETRPPPDCEPKTDRDVSRFMKIGPEREELDMEHGISAALARLADWRSTLVQGAVIDARSGLTVTDLDAIIAQAHALEHLGEAVEHSLDA